MAIETINPSTGELLAAYEETSPDEVKALLNAVDRAFAAWSQTDIEQRGRLLHRAADVLRRRGGEYSALMAREMGKPLFQGKAEVEKSAWVCEYYATHGSDFLADQSVATDATRSYVSFRPLGTVLAVMPWNFPFWQVFRFAAPALMAGNTGVLKHASNVTGCALAIEEVFREAGMPADVFRTLVIGAGRVRSVIEAPQIKAVTLTGSGPAGRAVAAAAGAALKKTVLELGGSDPYVVLEDANLDETVDTCVTSRLINSGQSCIAAKRFIVVASIKEAFERRYVEVMRDKTMGDPFGAVDVGPLARRDLRDELHQQVVGSVERGARLLLGGTVPDGPGAFYPPTVLADVRPGMPAYDDELFGPVAAVIEARDETEAVRIANDSAFGLGAAVFTSDAERGERIARDRLHAGACFVNAFVKSDPRLPFGGIKDSGYGRELAAFGIREFVNIKAVYVK
ncbi:MAG: NAD-dependent succinate-semialdehyde dehydrogenase [Gemmatimonadota bacterium]|nr:NAD-dependent succinate-semialdehyde dehydrogenase [Gemmatimonadota bacterium]MDH3366392.1 NAD-dependent succinate-semialdehyde dehydrogenase [Gemmatimonadota bacterium]MDH3477578.1 NAD-dependent succinate-semialdehyde dehydrogenase [Gemmatimonadota bacterium]MDH5548669.1 NAD-dependent succinate-semialdehyde dehydrogenase [Gemmatimonadota bacterium]